MSDYFGSVNSFVRDALTGVGPTGRGKSDVIAIPVSRGSTLGRAHQQINKTFDDIESSFFALAFADEEGHHPRSRRASRKAPKKNAKKGGRRPMSSLEAAALTLGTMAAIEAASDLKKWASDQIDSASDYVKKGVKEASQWAGNTLDTTKEAVKAGTTKTADTMTKGFTDTIVETRGVFSTGYESIKSYASDVFQSVGDFWSKVETYADKFNSGLFGVTEPRDPKDADINKNKDADATVSGFWQSIYSGAQAWIGKLVETFLGWTPEVDKGGGGGGDAQAEPPAAPASPSQNSPFGSLPGADSFGQGGGQGSSPYGALPGPDSFGQGGANQSGRQGGGAQAPGTQAAPAPTPSPAPDAGASGATPGGATGASPPGGASAAPPAQPAAPGADIGPIPPSGIAPQGSAPSAPPASPPSAPPPASTPAAVPTPRLDTYGIGMEPFDNSLRAAVQGDVTAAAGMNAIGRENVHAFDSERGRSFVDHWKQTRGEDPSETTSGMYVHAESERPDLARRAFIGDKSDYRMVRGTAAHELGHAASFKTRDDYNKGINEFMDDVAAGRRTNENYGSDTRSMSMKNLTSIMQLSNEGAWFQNRVQEEARQRLRDIQKNRSIENSKFDWSFVRKYTDPVDPDAPWASYKPSTGDEFRVRRMREEQLERATSVIESHSDDLLKGRVGSEPVAETNVDPTPLPSSRVRGAETPAAEQSPASETPAATEQEVKRTSRLEYLSTDPGYFIVDLGAYA